MKTLLRNASISWIAAAAFLAPQLFASDLPYWVEPCTNPKSGCLAEDAQLAHWALEAWQRASNGRIRLVESPDQDHAPLQIVWAVPTQNLYGETVPIRAMGRRGALVNIRIVTPEGNDRLLRDTVVYLTCLHESGHALGMEHTDRFADIMYSFEYGGDIREYFARYRRKLTTREDIRKNSGLSPDDVKTFAKTTH